MISNVNEFDGSISFGEIEVICDDSVLVDAVITNLGYTTLSELGIEVIVNEQVV